jgi:LPXTG-motif cell wall-anchored protein
VNRRSSITVIGLALAAMLIASSAAAAQPVRGFAAYKISLSSPMGQRSLLLNESSSPSDKAGFSDLVLQLIGTQQNLSYSRLVNASEDFLPYLPSVAPQSLDYKGTGYSLQANVTAPGTADVTFDGSQYTMNVMAISFAASYGNRSIEANGTVETFPSSLVYSVSVGSGFVRVDVTLQATDLPLTSPDSQVSSTTYVGAGVGMGAAALGGVFLIRRRERKAKQPEEKPLHWVD